MTHKILLTDDDKELCELLQSYLHAEGFDVICCYQGDEAVDYLKTAEVDLLILDVMMPGKTDSTPWQKFADLASFR